MRYRIFIYLHNRKYTYFISVKFITSFIYIFSIIHRLQFPYDTTSYCNYYLTATWYLNEFLLHLQLDIIDKIENRSVFKSIFGIREFLIVILYLVPRIPRLVTVIILKVKKKFFRNPESFVKKKKVRDCLNDCINIHTTKYHNR